MTVSESVNALFERQLKNWATAASGFAALENVRIKYVEVGPRKEQYKVQYNPARIVSSGAKVDSKSIRERKCFLCAANRPQEQEGIPVLGRYEILLNPFPIFPHHLTIPGIRHTPQRIKERISDMLLLAQMLPDYTLFYNGPKCGASAPDHFHFQAGNKGYMSLDAVVDKDLDESKSIARIGTAFVVPLEDKEYLNAFVLRTQQVDDASALFRLVYKAMEQCLPGEEEPMMNLLAFYNVVREDWSVVILPRAKHRPDCYFAEGEGRLLSSPASVDLGGVFITPVEADFDKITGEHIAQILQECCICTPKKEMLVECIRGEMQKEPTVSVGIMSGKDVKVSYHLDGTFTLHDVTIGKKFHWERKEDQRFYGLLTFVREGNELTAVNVLPVEEYLLSVISSEMSAHASMELLKAHAVISRSWLLANLRSLKENESCSQEVETHQPNASVMEGKITDSEGLSWYERDGHTLYDVCADDHCQRYQGITRQTTSTVRTAVRATRGEVLVYDNKICDARFSKTCGGIMEEFSTCWSAEGKYPYLVGKFDNEQGDTAVIPNLSIEEEAEKWIRSAPPSFCNTRDKRVLAQVLNNYDQETQDFYRWKVIYSQEEVRSLVKERTGIDFGDIIDLQPVQRGTSGRMLKLRIVGTKHVSVIGKELEIRRTLSKSHLYSSAFVVDKLDVNAEDIPQTFILTGAGWGHGVGLCQIGAAVMADRGYTYRQILAHYFPGAKLETRY